MVGLRRDFSISRISPFNDENLEWAVLFFNQLAIVKQPSLSKKNPTGRTDIRPPKQGLRHRERRAGLRASPHLAERSEESEADGKEPFSAPGKKDSGFQEQVWVVKKRP